MAFHAARAAVWRERAALWKRAAKLGREASLAAALDDADEREGLRAALRQVEQLAELPTPAEVQRLRALAARLLR